MKTEQEIKAMCEALDKKRINSLADRDNMLIKTWFYDRQYFTGGFEMKTKYDWSNIPKGEVYCTRLDGSKKPEWYMRNFYKVGLTF